jgi:uncharacterized protein YegJ (DUF2314 family)
MTNNFTSQRNELLENYRTVVAGRCSSVADTVKRFLSGLTISKRYDLQLKLRNWVNDRLIDARRDDMPRSYWIMGIAALAIAGCGKKSPPDRVVNVKEDDPGMNAAIEKARSSVETFIPLLKSPKPGQTSFSVKMAFVDGENTEHMWLIPVTFDGKVFRGTINNDPEKVKNVKIGQKASVEPDKISDWMYVENRKLVGGFTLRVLRDGMSPAERAEFDKGLPFKID